MIARPCLLLFTRYPQPGLVKTRLIPALGAAGAARLHRDLTAHTLRRAQAFCAAAGVDLVIWSDGGSLADLRRLFGRDLSYRRQPAGNLGQRLSAALADSLGQGWQQIVLIGSDCPELTGPILGTAFARLAAHDLVLGPARDGGYYLIGLKALHPALFQGIPWGTDQVLAQTISQAQYLGLQTALLEPLSDIDRPEDLPVWENIVRQENHA